ncbi:alpha/beta hydrolase [Rhodobacteraceae bacterium N5(2021)]|uniref:Alpha/beta hydrolase n=2 Tax=Gymnodinialimonas phycosphaerae TaxID=2841589 RepID=A0A975TZA7_9RHOB|nr:alpha/beta hydrolase [Gymnodinialimonas phycosphaerae]
MCDDRLFGPQLSALGGEVLNFGRHEDMIGDMASRVLHDAPDRFALVGLSMGGIVAMEMIRQAPQRIDRVALLDTNPLPEADAVKTRRASQIAQVRAGRLAEVIRDEMKPNYLGDTPARQALLDLCMDMALSLGPEIFVNQSVALRDRIDQTGTLRGYDRPALVLCGREDQLCPVARHELMHGLLPNSTLTIIDGAGHLPTLERPVETTAALRRWLERS